MLVTRLEIFRQITSYHQGSFQFEPRYFCIVFHAHATRKRSSPTELFEPEGILGGIDNVDRAQGKSLL